MPIELLQQLEVEHGHNYKSIGLICKFYEFTKFDCSLEHDLNNSLKVVIYFGNFIGKDNSFYDNYKKEQFRIP